MFIKRADRYEPNSICTISNDRSRSIGCRGDARYDVYNSETVISPCRIREIGRGGVRWRNGDGIAVSLCAGVDAAAAAVVARHPSFLHHEKVLEIN